MICSSWSRLRQSSPLLPGGQYLPAPYSPSSLVASWVSSVRLAASLGAGTGLEIFSSWIGREISGGRSRPLYFFDSSISWLCSASERSLALALSSWVSSLMKVSETQAAALLSGYCAFSCVLTFSTNCAASVALALGGATDAAGAAGWLPPQAASSNAGAANDSANRR